ncbi:Lrp/AsnC family transcriptional regulator [Saccharothrix obliqua]|uniref:Lrp/AsnC family transcriptional regulator n=1 Tax=Saccharothrix obliqua TaxID=2861747 RepID=UPI001C5F768D|nr:Lrp/AsnC family transcriptional regulator [Saccharothrix obliqua]MBW4722486.1 Lrp/AsnC family transcriptional regulator [Saccharothrix obliqua]
MSGDMDELDSLDRRIVAALQVNGRASWTEIAALAATSVTTVARRAQQLFARGLIRVAAVPQQSGATELLMVRLQCAAGTQIEVARAIATRPEVRFLALVTGSHDLIAEVLVPKGAALQALLVDGLQNIPGIQRSVADLELHTYKSNHEWSRAVLGDGDFPLPEPHVCAADDLDDLDHRILAALSADGRAAFQAVAGELGVSESTVRRRFEAALHRGCVQVITLVPAAALGFEAEIIYWLSVAPARLQAVAEELAAHRGVRYVTAMLGQESLMCEVILPTNEDVLRFTTETLAGLDGVQAWTANVELLTLKRGFVRTPWSAAQLSGATAS